MHKVLRDGVRQSPGSGFTRRGILAALGGLGLAAPLGIAEAKRGKAQKRRKERRAVSAASSPNGDAPVNYCGETSTCEFGPIEGACTFPIQLEISGKTKTLELPGGRFIVTAPGQTATITNLLDESKQVTFNVTGSSHQSIGTDGTQYFVATGNNILYDPVARPNLGYTQGRFTFVFAADGSLQESRAGTGNVTDICDLIA